MDEKTRKRIRIDCKIEQLPEDVKSDVIIMMGDTSISLSQISEWLKEQGFDISTSAVRRYYKRTEEDNKRLRESLIRMKAVVKIANEYPDVDATKAGRIIAMEGLLKRITDADDDFSDMELTEAIRLLTRLSQLEIHERRAKQSYKTKMELALDKMEEDMKESIKSDPALAKEFRDVMQKARERLLGDE